MYSAPLDFAASVKDCGECWVWLELLVQETGKSSVGGYDYLPGFIFLTASYDRSFGCCFRCDAAADKQSGCRCSSVRVSRMDQHEQLVVPKKRRQKRILIPGQASTYIRSALPVAYNLLSVVLTSKAHGQRSAASTVRAFELRKR